MISFGYFVKKKENFVVCDKKVTKAIENTGPIILLLAANDGINQCV